MTGGKTVKEQLLAVWKATKRKPKELDYGDIPEGFTPTWDAFCRLSRRRQVGMGPSAIGYADIAAFAALSGITIAPWQLQAIEHLDGLWLAIHG